MLEEDFVEYKSAGASVGSEFNTVVKSKEPDNVAATQARAIKAKAAEVEQDDEDNSSPF